MIQIDDAIVALDVIEENFICDLSVCQGECCVEGESGAPLENEEVEIIEKLLPAIWDDLSPKAQEVINAQGVAYKDRDGDMVTSIVNGKDCVFTYYDDKGICKCAIEKAHKEGKTDFYKPISCHLYPIRLEKFREFTAVNYHRWRICKAAVLLGNKEGLRIYQFLKEPLIRKFGNAWYNELCIAADEYKEMKKNGLTK
ncbi:uncharacterized protein DUF3109 [Dysgonomonas alginatilytica]|uniref:Uncharacterized protein DUF3109 n=1 Tax=Dysgonomonas alginatilytica TaxID=1605892 RepID=A0A2V3PQT1_9BACT|nr:DUF3109 family protein [Dysgonomonas alginatilytica]PXV64111.1 uncharacterized protein DUF3109 [Dysgonomonas alginatilytica]